MKRNSIFSIFGALIIMSAVTGMSGCNQPNSASKDTPTPQMPNLIDVPKIAEVKLNALWEVKQNGNHLFYAFKEAASKDIYLAYTPDNGSTFKKMTGIEDVKFEDGRISMKQGGQVQKYAVKENGTTLELYLMHGDKAVGVKQFILEKDTDSTHASWGNSIKTATP